MPSYYELNREKINNRRKQLYKENEESRKKALERNRRWREKHKEELKQRNKEYRNIGYYKNKLESRFNVLKNEIFMDNVSDELIEEFKEIVEELKKLNMIDENLYEAIQTYFT